MLWFLLLGEYGITFDYLSGGKNDNTYALSRLGIDSLEIKENKKEVLKNLSGSEHSSTSNIKLTILIHSTLIFNEKSNVKETRFRQKNLAQPHCSIQHIKVYDIICYKDKIYTSQSFRQIIKITVAVI
jgi:hypothetical protein